VAERVKVLRVIARLNVGGPALHVAYLTEGLAERGYATTLVAGSLAYGEESMAHVARQRGARIVALPHLAREVSPLNDLLAVWHLAKLIRAERPQIVHTHTAKAGAVGRVAALLAGAARPPIVVHTFHGHVLRGYFNPLTTLGFRTLERWLATVTTRLIAVSPEVRDDLVRLGVAPREKFTVIRLGIALDERVGGDDEARRETRRRLGILPEAFVVGWVGRMTAVKRTDLVVSALERLVARNVDAFVVLVGDGPDRDHLERYAHELGVIKRCLFLGYQEDVARFYDAVDVLVLPSINEGTPVSVIEALAARRPAVATRVGGVPDVVRDGVDGFLVDSDDPDDIAERLAELASDPVRRAAMGEAGHARVLERYAVDRLVDDVDKLYRELLAARGLPLPASPRGTLRNAFQAGFFLPAGVSRPDCQPPRLGSSLMRNQRNMSMRGFARAIL
jgi:glycosyltransferase involved in cell wall biosynthesis